MGFIDLYIYIYNTYIYIYNINIYNTKIYYTIYMYKIYPSLFSSLSLSFSLPLFYAISNCVTRLCGPRYLYFRSLKWHWHLLVMTLRVLPRRGQKPHVCSLTHTHIYTHHCIYMKEDICIHIFWSIYSHYVWYDIIQRFKHIYIYLSLSPWVCDGTWLLVNSHLCLKLPLSARRHVSHVNRKSLWTLRTANAQPAAGLLLC